MPQPEKQPIPTPKEYECPECECTFDIEEPEGLEPGDVTTCPECDSDLIMEDDGSLTVGELSDEDAEYAGITDEYDPDDEEDDDEDED